MLETEAKLNQIIDEIHKDMHTVSQYAGTAYCTETEDESQAKFFQGQYIALKRTMLAIEKHMLYLMMKREEQES